MKMSIKQIITNRHFFLKTVLSLMIAYLLVNKCQELSFEVLKANFGRALLINFLVIYMLISIVSNLTGMLDHYHPWHKNYIKRVAYQLLFGILAPLLLATAAVTFYCSFCGTMIWDTVFFETYLPQLLMALVGINFYLYFEGKRKTVKHKIRNHQQ